MQPQCVGNPNHHHFHEKDGQWRCSTCNKMPRDTTHTVTLPNPPERKVPKVDPDKLMASLERACKGLGIEPVQLRDWLPKEDHILAQVNPLQARAFAVSRMRYERPPSGVETVNSWETSNDERSGE